MNNDQSANGKLSKIKSLAQETLGTASHPQTRANAAWGSIEQTITEELIDKIVLMSASLDEVGVTAHSIWLRLFRTLGILSMGELRRHHLVSVESYLSGWANRLKSKLPPTQRTPGWRVNIINRIVKRATTLRYEQRLANLLRTCHAINITDLTDPQLEAVFTAVSGWTAPAANVA